MKTAFVTIRQVNQVVAAIIFIVLSLSGQAYSEEQEVPPKPLSNSQTYFKSINRLQYRYSINGESAISQGSFVLLPYEFNIAELSELSTTLGESNKLKFDNFSVDVKLARYLVPSAENGRIFSWVARFQAASKRTDSFSIGLQWNISETPNIKRATEHMPWKSLFQVFVKENSGDGYIDLFHWYQFPILNNNKLYIRGVNTYFFLPGKEDCINVVQDLIHPLDKRWDVFFRHSYQNIEGFLNHSKGSELSIGLRMIF